MAGPLLEVVKKNNENIPVEIIPAVSAYNAAAAKFGAPIMHDHCSISLSDRLTPWEIIQKRLHLAAAGDFVVSIYNPKSKGRSYYINEAKKIFQKYRESDTPVGIAKNVERNDESIILTTLENMLDYEIDMFTIVIIGNSSTKINDNLMITPRGYKI